MKKTLILLIFISFIYSCSSDNDDTTFYGKWKAIEEIQNGSYESIDKAPLLITTFSFNESKEFTLNGIYGTHQGLYDNNANKHLILYNASNDIIGNINILSITDKYLELKLTIPIYGITTTKQIKLIRI